MKKCKVIFSFIALLVMMSVAAFPAQAADHPEEPYYITAYHVDIDVSEDNVSCSMRLYFSYLDEMGIIQ